MLSRHLRNGGRRLDAHLGSPIMTPILYPRWTWSSTVSVFSIVFKGLLAEARTP